MVFSLCQLLIKDLYLVYAYALAFYAMSNCQVKTNSQLLGGKYPFNKTLQKHVQKLQLVNNTAQFWHIRI